MTSGDIILLSSSPEDSWIATTPPRAPMHRIPSSPALPSMSELLSKHKPDIGIGSSTSPISAGVNRGFIPASRLLAEEKAVEGFQDLSRFLYDPRPPVQLRRSPSNSRLENAQSMAVDVVVPPLKMLPMSRKKSTTTGKQAAEIASLPKDLQREAVVEATLAKTFRPRKAKGEAQTKIKKTRVVKPSTGDAGEGKVVKNARAVVKRTPTTEIATEELAMDIAPNSKPSEEFLGHGVSIAEMQHGKRVVDHTSVQFDGHSDFKVLQSDSNDPVLTSDTARRINLEDAGSKHVEGHAVATPRTRAVCGPATAKRRKVESTDTHPLAKKTKKCRSPKKKPQTVTGKATEDFRAVVPIDSPLLRYLDQATFGDRFIAKPVAVAAEEDAPKTSKALSEAKKPRAGGAKGKKSATILLAPEEAMRVTNDQDLLFGTSSQLMREDSPSFIQEIQKATSVPESFKPLSDSPVAPISKPMSSTESSVSRRTSSRNLWFEAARDSQGAVLDLEVIDLMETPKLLQSAKLNVTARAVKTAMSAAQANDDWKPIDEIAASRVGAINGNFAEPSQSFAQVTDVLHSIPRSVAEAALRPRLKSRSPVKKKKSLKPQEGALDQMPNYQGFTMNQLSTAVSSFGFKAIKSRDAMVSLLEKCWEGKHRLALQSLPPNTTMPILLDRNDKSARDAARRVSPAKRRGRQSKHKDVPPIEEVLAITTAPAITAVTEAPKSKSRGRPRKEKTDATNVADTGTSKVVVPISKPPSKRKRKAAVPLPDDIEDPNPPPTPSPPRRRSSQSPLQALPLLPIATTTKLANDHQLTEPALFAKMTEAITTYPPTHDPKNLSWYEKILLYDPIVLEDLAAWLNTEGLGRVGVDEEVGALQVRSWCEGRSVCCLWRETLRGGTRKRY